MCGHPLWITAMFGLHRRTASNKKWRKKEEMQYLLGQNIVIGALFPSVTFHTFYIYREIKQLSSP